MRVWEPGNNQPIRHDRKLNVLSGLSYGKIKAVKSKSLAKLRARRERVLSFTGTELCLGRNTHSKKVLTALK
jgi:hypothetical protein